MAQGFVYIVGASNNPDDICCMVPFRIDDKYIFFGPCKKGLREKFKKEYSQKFIDNEDIFIIGLNAANHERKRNIVWAGKVIKLMTFKEAYNNSILRKLRNYDDLPKSPLHVKPVSHGYQLVSVLHAEDDEWINDLVSKGNKNKIKHNKKENIITGLSNEDKTFDRDLCFLTSNIFFAKDYGKGIEITDNMMNLFKEVQPEKEGVDSYAIFGLREKNRTVDGKTGKWLEMKDNKIYSLIHAIENAAKKIPRVLKVNSSNRKVC